MGSQVQLWLPPGEGQWQTREGCTAAPWHVPSSVLCQAQGNLGMGLATTPLQLPTFLIFCSKTAVQWSTEPKQVLSILTAVKGLSSISLADIWKVEEIPKRLKAWGPSVFQSNALPLSYSPWALISNVYSDCEKTKSLLLHISREYKKYGLKCQS